MRPLAGVVIEEQRVSLARADKADVILTVGIAFWRLVLAVPQAAEDVGKAQILTLEHHQHFIAHFREEHRPAVVAGHRDGDARPVTFARLAMPGVANLHPTQAVRILVLRYQCHGHALDESTGLETGFVDCRWVRHHHVVSLTLKRVR
jgi:hypothetical protein